MAMATMPVLSDRDREMLETLESMIDRENHAVLLLLKEGPLGDADIAKATGWGVMVRGLVLTDLIDSGLVTAAEGRYSLDTERVADAGAYVASFGHKTITLGSRER